MTAKENDTTKNDFSHLSFREALLNPSLLNLLCGIFALERQYQIMGISWMHDEKGHLCVIGLYTIGFLIGLLLLCPIPTKKQEEKNKQQGRMQNLRNCLHMQQKRIYRWVKIISYSILVIASIKMLCLVNNDINFANDNKPGPSQAYATEAVYECNSLRVKLSDGRYINVPYAWLIQCLDKNEGDLSDPKIGCNGKCVDWPKLKRNIPVIKFLRSTELCN